MLWGIDLEALVDLLAEFLLVDALLKYLHFLR